MKDLLIRCLHHEKVERAPWVPFAGVHAGFLKGYTATEMLTDADKAFESLMEVNRLYKPDGQPVIFDLQIEAECLGCGLVWADDCPPSVSDHPLDGSDEEPPETPCACKIPKKTDGRIPYVLDVMHRMKEAVGDTTALYGLICGPFTLASHLRGNNLFTDMYDFEDEVAELFDFCKKVCIRMADYYLEAGMDVIAMVDPLTSVMLLGNQQDNMKFTVDLLDSLEDKTNFILAPGCDMPYAVPVENCIGVAQAAIETDAVREMVKNYQAAEVDTSGVVLPDYAHLEKPLVEAFTLDSAQCAACGYMMGAVNEAKATFGDAIDVVEYKYIYKENVARCVKMGVPNLPSLYINGELKYKSIIPTKAELEASIREALEKCGK